MKPNSPGLVLGLLLVCFVSTPFSNAECTLSSFEDGQVASAEEINCNFQVLESEISALSAATPPGRPTVIHVAKEGGDYDSLTTALGNLSPPVIVGGPVLVKIAPGVYQESVTSDILNNNVFIEGSGKGVTVLEYAQPEAAIVMEDSVLKSGLSDLTIRNTAGPGIMLSATNTSFIPNHDESSFYINNVEVNVSAPGTVTAIDISGPIWVTVTSSDVQAYATASGFTAVNGIKLDGLMEFKLSNSRVWANGGLLTQTFVSQDTRTITLSDSDFKISRLLQELGAYSNLVSAADGINIADSTQSRSGYRLRGLSVVAESSEAAGTGRGIVATAGARVDVYASNIYAASGADTTAYAADANGADGTVGSRIDIIGSRAVGERRCTNGCRNVCFLSSIIPDDTSGDVCTGVSLPP